MRGHPLAQVVATYLVTGETAEAIGLYHLPIDTISHGIGSPFEGASEGLRRCIEAGFCRYDRDGEIVWIPRMAGIQIAERLTPHDKRVTWIGTALGRFRRHVFGRDFLALYRDTFSLPRYPWETEAPSEGLASPIEAPSSGAGARSGTGTGTGTIPEEELSLDARRGDGHAREHVARALPGLEPEMAQRGPAAAARRRVKRDPAALPFTVAEALTALAYSAGNAWAAVEPRDIGKGIAIALNHVVRRYPTLSEWETVGAFLGAGGVTFPRPPLGPSWVASAAFGEAMAAARAWDTAGRRLPVAGASPRGNGGRPERGSAPVSTDFEYRAEDDRFSVEYRGGGGKP